LIFPLSPESVCRLPQVVKVVEHVNRLVSRSSNTRIVRADCTAAQDLCSEATSGFLF